MNTDVLNPICVHLCWRIARIANICGKNFIRVRFSRHTQLTLVNGLNRLTPLGVDHSATGADSCSPL